MAAKTPELDFRSFTGKNKIINGDMRVNQRFGNTVATLTNGIYNLDRWAGQKSNAGVVTVQRATDSLPAGYTHAMKFIVTTADASVAAGDYDGFHQYIEGYNCADLDFGRSTAKDVTLSFWVRSSKIGIYSGSLMNSANNRSRTFEYTINALNTWEYKTITIAGDQTGTWLVDNGIGLRLFFSFMAGTTYQQAAGSWGVSGNAVATANQVNFLDTVNNTFYITGVQLEAGNQATSFERENFHSVLQACRRYYEKSYDIDVAPATVTDEGRLQLATLSGANKATFEYKTTKRASPTTTFYNNATGTSGQIRISGGGGSAVPSVLSYRKHFTLGFTGALANQDAEWQFTADAEL